MNTLYRIRAIPVLLAFALACRLDKLIDTPPPGVAPTIRLAFRQAPSTATAGQAITPPIEVVAVNASGAPITNFTGTIHLALADPPSGTTLSGSTDTTATSGVATFPGVRITRAGTAYRLTATAEDVAGVTSAAFAINPGPADRLTFTAQPTTTPQNDAITPAVRVTVLDGHGNVAAGFTGTVSMSIGRDGSALQNATLEPGGAQRAAAAGVATFADLRIDQPGVGYTLAASAPTLEGAESASFNVTLVQSNASRLEFSEDPSDVTVDESIFPPVVVRAVDDDGNPAGSFTGVITLTLANNPTGAALSGASVPAVAGVATFEALRLDRAGTGYTLRAAASGLPAVSSEPFNVTQPPPVPSALRFTAQPTTTPLSHAIGPIEVMAVDDAGDPATSFAGDITIAIEFDASLLKNARLSGTRTVTAVSGRARFTDLSIDQIGVGYTLRAAATGLAAALSQPFTIVAAP